MFSAFLPLKTDAALIKPGCCSCSPGISEGNTAALQTDCDTGVRDILLPAHRDYITLQGGAAKTQKPGESW
jgi:hypothetical protein